MIYMVEGSSPPASKMCLTALSKMVNDHFIADFGNSPLGTMTHDLNEGVRRMHIENTLVPKLRKWVDDNITVPKENGKQIILYNFIESLSMLSLDTVGNGIVNIVGLDVLSACVPEADIIFVCQENPEPTYPLSQQMQKGIKQLASDHRTNYINANVPYLHLKYQIQIILEAYRETIS